ncbi:MAG: aminopeptidase [Coriobacteriales bacterium]|nr:aminopeptidase [Coriobacteriales bacterium]
MDDLTNKLQKYAQLIIRSGCNLQPGQELLLSASTDTCEFARIVTAEAYKQGARRVTVRFADEKITRLHYENCALEVFESFPQWQALLNNSMAAEGAAVLMLLSEDPLALVGIDQKKLVAQSRASYEACKPYHDTISEGKLVWCIVGAAAPGWASHVYPDLPVDVAVEKLWQAILATVRVDAEDPVAAWEEHRSSFNERKAWLNAQGFDRLHYKNSLGTDLVVGLNDKGLWQGGGDVTVTGTEFFPNMPTEEIFTTPNRLRADGVVYSSMPLIHYGSPVEDFSITFKDGKVTRCTARVGQDVLEAIFSVDEGAGRLGECALVPWSSPIQQSGVLFYNTLYDENASCHLAVGKGFSDCFEGGQQMSEDELLAAGVNKSATHVDFMIGTADLSIDGIKPDGSVLPLFEQGNWVF